MAVDPALASYIEEEVARRVEERLAPLRAEIAAMGDRLGHAEERTVSNRATIVVFSGEMDNLMAAFIIATGAAAMGLDVSMYFTFWGLTALRKERRFAGKSLPEKMVAAMLPSGPGAVATSRLNMMGIGPQFFKLLMRQRHVSTLPDLVGTAREMGIKMVACQMSMGVMGVKPEELIDGISFGGVATYMEDASDSKLTLFI